jgi:hypothetical protein
MPRPSHSSFFDRPNIIWSGAETPDLAMKCLTRGSQLAAAIEAKVADDFFEVL